MLRRLFIEKIKNAVLDWAKQYPRVELADVYVYPGGFVDDYHVIFVATTGFENWRQSAREDDLYRFLRMRLGDTDIVKIFFLLAVTEEESEYYAGLHSTAASGVETFPLALRGSRKQRAFIAKVKNLIQEWAALYPTVELTSIEVNPNGFPDDYDVIVVAGKGFENWEKREREKDLYWFLRKQLGDADIVKIWVLLALTEEQYEKYEVTHDAALV
jgi:hypothetical protein